MQSQIVASKINTIIRIDRSVRPRYPDFARTITNIELENTGPAEYDLTSVKQWLHDGQKKYGYVRAQVVYDYLKSNKMLGTCLGFADGISIREQGIKIFRKFFRGNTPLLWRSVAQRYNEDYLVPYLYEEDAHVKIGWYLFGNNLLASHPALRFAS